MKKNSISARILQILIIFALYMYPVFLSEFAHAQDIQSLPPGGAVLLTPPGETGTGTSIESFEAPKTGSALLVDGKRQIVYQAPTEIENSTSISFAYKLTSETTPRSFSVIVDPNFSALKTSVTSTAIEWLFVLLIIALFIEAAVFL